jgi:hypothetical protein
VKFHRFELLARELEAAEHGVLHAAGVDLPRDVGLVHEGAVVIVARAVAVVVARDHEVLDPRVRARGAAVDVGRAQARDRRLGLALVPA